MQHRITRVFHYERLERHVMTHTNVNFFTVKELLLAYEVSYGFINNACLPVNAHNMEIKHGRCQTLSIGENSGAMFFSYRAHLLLHADDKNDMNELYCTRVLKIFI